MKSSLHKLFLLSVFICVNLWLNSLTIEVKQDGSGDFLTIQDGIEESADGDTVLVHPGTYIENVDLDGKDITLASLEMTTANRNYIKTTIIDANQTGSCIRVRSNENDVVIRGFTLRNGKGTYDGEYLGGGIFFKNAENCFVQNCLITENVSEGGSGIAIKYSSITLSGVTIKNNGSGTGGGGLFLWGSDVTFDSSNKCNIYNNYAGNGNDIYLIEMPNTSIIVDTFTVSNPTRYYLNFDDESSYSINIENSILEEINHDLYVSSIGNDNNSGTSPDEPLKTIAWAMHNIQSDQDNPKTIHIADGIYGESQNDQLFPISLKSNVMIKGESIESTVFDGNWNNHTMIFLGNNIGNIKLETLTFQQNHSRLGVIYGARTTDAIEFKDLKILNCTSYQYGAIKFYLGEIFIMDNVTIKDINAEDYSAFSISSFESITIDNCTITNCVSLGDNPHFGAGLIKCRGDIVVSNSSFIGNKLEASSMSPGGSALSIAPSSSQQGNFYLKNTLFADNISLGTCKYAVMIDTAFDNSYVSNCTFVNNSSERTINLNGDIDVTNCIFDNDVFIEALVPDLTWQGLYSEVNFEHNNFVNGQSSVGVENNANTINWLEGNIFEPVLFLDSEETPYQLSDLSPCIDTGTPDTLGLFLPPWDLLGNNRVWDGNGDGVAVIDMGCYEFGAPSIVSSEPNVVLEVTGYNLLNYPNPFNPTTTISFSTTEGTEDTEIEIYNIKGQRIVTLSDPSKTDSIEGRQTQSVIWNGVDQQNNPVSSGVYFATLRSGKKVLDSKKMLLLK